MEHGTTYVTHARFPTFFSFRSGRNSLQALCGGTNREKIDTGAKVLQFLVVSLCDVSTLKLGIEHK